MEREVSHAEIYRELGVLQGKMDAILVSQTTNDADKRSIFQRLGQLETRMAQVVIVAVLVSLTLPPIVSFITRYVQIGSHPAQPAE